MLDQDEDRFSFDILPPLIPEQTVPLVLHSVIDLHTQYSVFTNRPVICEQTLGTLMSLWGKKRFVKSLYHLYNCYYFRFHFFTLLFIVKKKIIVIYICFIWIIHIKKKKKSGFIITADKELLSPV